jgi:dTDP-4-dehydrorhamnose reductase
MKPESPPSSVRILLTGANGQVGSKLMHTLAAFGQVFATDSPHAAAATGHLSLDLCDLDAVTRMVREIRPQIIVNPAAHTAVDKAETEEPLAAAINTEAPRRLAQEAKASGALLVHYSTDYVFDGSGSSPRDEAAPTGPLNAYGRTKLAGEQAIAASGCQHVILRTSWVYSDHGHNFVKTMLKLAMERETLRIVADQIGAPTSAAFLARKTARVIDRRLRHDGFVSKQRAADGVYHLTCGGATSWHAFALEIFSQARSLGIPLKVKEVEAIPTSAYPTPAKRPLNSRLDCAKFFTTFGGAQVQWTEALRDVMTVLNHRSLS